jgi:hypothetical protein
VGWDVEGMGVVRADLPQAESLAGFDAVLIDPEPLSDLWRGHALLEGDGVWRLYPERDLGLSRALERLFLLRRGEVEGLLFQGGVMAVRVRPPGEGVEIVPPGGPPRRMDRYSFLPHVSLVSGPHHLSFPQGIRFLPRRGRDMVDLEAHPINPYLLGLREWGYEAVISSSLGTPLSAFGPVLARDRVGDAVAWDLPVGNGRILFLPSFPGAEPAKVLELLLPALAALVDAPLAAGAPEWLSHYLLPGEEEMGGEREALERERERLSRREEALAAAQAGYDALRGLLFPRGVRGLKSATQAALERLGFSVTTLADDPRALLAHSPEGEVLVRVALSLSGPVGPEEHRALWLTLDRLRAKEGHAPHGVLVVVAEPRLDPRRRGTESTEALRQGCQHHGLGLVFGHDLFRATAHVLSGGDPAPVRSGLLSQAGEWRFRG